MQGNTGPFQKCPCVCLQENKPIGTSILKLAVTDEDSIQNGPPYQFTILSGNDGQEFVLEKDGTLVSNKVLRRDQTTEHVLQIQVNAEPEELLVIFLSSSISNTSDNVYSNNTVCKTLSD